MINNIIERFVKELSEMKVKLDKEGNPKKTSEFELATHIFENSAGNLISTGGKFNIFHNGRFVGIEGRAKSLDFVKSCIVKVTGEKHVRANTIETVAKELNTYYHELIPYITNSSTFINMMSNVVEITKDGVVIIHPHDKKYNFTYQLKYDYDNAAKSPIFEKFIITSLGDEDLKNIILEYLAYVLNKSSKNYEKALFLFGSGANGKSTFLNIIKHLFGVENISHIELTQMGDKNECALMDGKLLNISSDANRRGLDTGAFKKIVSGEPILGKYLFKDVYTIYNLPKLIIALNKLPGTNGDNTFGFYRRGLIIPFNKTIEEKDKDYDLERKVVENELPGILNMVIEGLVRLNKQSGFSKSTIVNEITNTYIESTNHIPTFLEEECYEAVPESSKKGTSLKDIFTDFKQWCLERGLNSYSTTYLSVELNQLGYKAYKNNVQHYRIKKRKLEDKTGFEPNTDDDYE